MSEQPETSCEVCHDDGREYELYLVVKYLRREADTIDLRDGVADHLRMMALALEKWDHRK